MVKFTLNINDRIYEYLREKAFKQRTSIKDLIMEAVMEKEVGKEGTVKDFMEKLGYNMVHDNPKYQDPPLSEVREPHKCKECDSTDTVLLAGEWFCATHGRTMFTTPIEDEIDYDPEVDEVHPCEGYGCRSTKTEKVEGQGIDEYGCETTFTKWLCEFHRKKVKPSG